MKLLNGNLTRGFILAALLMTTHASAAPPSQLILQCKGKLVGDYTTAPELGKEIEIAISQTPQNKLHNWYISVQGEKTIETGSNGPINPDGSTTSQDGQENVLFFLSATDGFVIKNSGSGLQGELKYLQGLKDVPEFWFLVTYALECQRTPVSINQSEADIYNARSEIASLAMPGDSPLILGVGIVPSESLKAAGLHVYLRDEAQKSLFLTDFQKRGLLVTKNKRQFYAAKTVSGKTRLIPLSMQITGDITPLP